MHKLTPTQRLILFSLRCKPRQSAVELGESTGTLTSYRLHEMIQGLLQMDLIRQEPYSSPAAYIANPEGLKNTMTRLNWREYVDGRPAIDLTQYVYPQVDPATEQGIPAPAVTELSNPSFAVPELE